MEKPPQNHDACAFCAIRESEDVIARNELAFALRDTTPVTRLHTLVLPIRHAPTYFDLSAAEVAAVDELLRSVRKQILDEDPTVSAFNMGANAGADAGQTIFHCHIHLIPRRKGDVDDPLGGVRAVIPERMRY
ncbi:HIT family protein [Sphingomonas oryzagri]